MGPAIETFLQVFFIVLVVLGGFVFATRFLWRRVWLFLRRWYQRDLELEREAERQKQHRVTAEKELKVYLHDEGAAPTQEKEERETPRKDVAR